MPTRAERPRSNAVTHALGLRPGETGVVGLAVGISFAGSAGLMIGGSAIEALFFARAGIQKLPAMYLILGAAMFLASVGVGLLLARMGRGRTSIAIPLALGALAVAGRLGLATGAGWILPALWLLQGAAQFLVGLSVWGLAGLVTDTRQAKRFFPLIGAGGVLGLVLGGLATKPLASALGTENLILVWAGGLLGVALLGWRLVATRAASAPGARDRGADPFEALRSGARSVGRSPMLRWMAIASILFSLLFFSLYLPFSRAATAQFPDPEDLAGFFGIFFGISTGVAFLTSLFLTHRLLARFGVPAVMLVLPLLYVVAFGVLTIDAGFAALLVFRFAQVAWMQGGAVSSWEAVINTVPANHRDQTRAFLYGGPTQVGTLLAGVIGLVGERAVSATTLYAIGLVSAVLATASMIGVRRAYPRELVAALREGRPSVFDAPPGGADPLGRARSDAAAVRVAVAAMAEPDPRVRRLAADALGDAPGRDARAALVDALRDEDADVRAVAVGALARAGAPEDLPRILELLRDPEALVRRAAVDAAGALTAGAPPPAVRALLHDPDPIVRARVAGLMLRDGGDHEAQAVLLALADDPEAEVRASVLRAARGVPALFDRARRAFLDPAPSVRAAAAGTLASIDARRSLETLVEATADEDPGVRRAVAEALGAIGSAAVAPVLRALGSMDHWSGALSALERLPIDGRDGEVRRFAAETIARAAEDDRLSGAIPVDGDERLALLRDSLRDRARRAAVAGLRAAALMGSRSEMSAALDNLSVSDPAQRATALEVIESVGDRALVRPLIEAWEGPPAPAALGPLLDRLADDPDEWIRACAALARAPKEGDPMTPNALSQMERILFLRRVLLFEELPPQDLAPVAAIAEERSFADGDAIAEQGEPGEAMHVIVDGEVTVVRRDATGEQQLAVRTSGDVVGEMAVITSEPRMAGLVARGPVRSLSIGRRQLEAMLRERPEISLAVIRVLCRRLAERPA